MLFFVVKYICDMRNFQIDIKNDGKYNIFFEHEFIGHIEYSEHDHGFLVHPHKATYTGFFRELETAIMELVFHKYAAHRAIPSC